MKCQNCLKKMGAAKAMEFNGFKIDGYQCACGEVYFDPDHAQRVLLLNKLQKRLVKAKLGRIRSNLILRLPKDIETALQLEQGEEVVLKVESDGLKILPVE
ncbi:MAG TPA: AbrB/MazE/SpoVT family DNA-binding domain-containing protein [Candidatus Nanoarchaeia archaeon]|nr:AbrB/MazE/SpoVT family DNA-binding domain-containing protein [Candidatus Nanoarchaeia archaeon]